jgi:hypothetical protein
VGIFIGRFTFTPPPSRITLFSRSTMLASFYRSQMRRVAALTSPGTRFLRCVLTTVCVRGPVLVGTRLQVAGIVNTEYSYRIWPFGAYILLAISSCSGHNTGHFVPRQASGWRWDSLGVELAPKTDEMGLIDCPINIDDVVPVTKIPVVDRDCITRVTCFSHPSPPPFDLLISASYLPS